MTVSTLRVKIQSSYRGRYGELVASAALSAAAVTFLLHSCHYNKVHTMGRAQYKGVKLVHNHALRVRQHQHQIGADA